MIKKLVIVVVLFALVCLLIMLVLPYTRTVNYIQRGMYEWELDRRITPTEARIRMEEDEAIVLLDVRTLSENDELRIPGDIVIPVDELESRAPEEIPDRNTRIFVYCRSRSKKYKSY